MPMLWGDIANRRVRKTSVFWTVGSGSVATGHVYRTTPGATVAVYARDDRLGKRPQDALRAFQIVL